jgi:hypothetical protein
LGPSDLELLQPSRKAIPAEVRDRDGRWREVLNRLNVSEVVGTAQLLEGFSANVFDDKQVEWWVEVAARITANHPDAEIFGVPFF